MYYPFTKTNQISLSLHIVEKAGKIFLLQDGEKFCNNEIEGGESDGSNQYNDIKSFPIS